MRGLVLLKGVFPLQQQVGEQLGQARFSAPVMALQRESSVRRRFESVLKTRDAPRSSILLTNGAIVALVRAHR
jgi:hypothetical protein